jgi:hypothetical protein
MCCTKRSRARSPTPMRSAPITSGHDRDLRMLMRDHRSPRLNGGGWPWDTTRPTVLGRAPLVSASTSTRAAKSGPTFGASQQSDRPAQATVESKTRVIERPSRNSLPAKLDSISPASHRVFPAHDAVARRDLLDRVTAAEPQGAWRGAHGGVGGGRCFDAVRPHRALWITPMDDQRSTASKVSPYGCDERERERET